MNIRRPLLFIILLVVILTACGSPGTNTQTENGTTTEEAIEQEVYCSTWMSIDHGVGLEVQPLLIHNKKEYSMSMQSDWFNRADIQFYRVALDIGNTRHEIHLWNGEIESIQIYTS